MTWGKGTHGKNSRSPASRLPIVSEVPEAPLRANEIARHPRVEAITWGAEDLSAELGAKRRRDGAGEYLEADFEFGRRGCSHCANPHVESNEHT